MKSLLLFVFSTVATAFADENPLERGAYDVAAPVVQNRANLVEATAGQLVFDSSSGAFYGLPVGGNPAVASAWVQISPNIGTNTVISSGSERIERALVNCSASSSVSSYSGSTPWVTGIGNISAGKCTLTFAPGLFSATPTCVTSAYTNSANAVGANVFPSSVTAATISYTCSGSACSSFDASLICMGPK